MTSISSIPALPTVDENRQGSDLANNPDLTPAPSPAASSVSSGRASGRASWTNRLLGSFSNKQRSSDGSVDGRASRRSAGVGATLINSKSAAYQQRHAIMKICFTVGGVPYSISTLMMLLCQWGLVPNSVGSLYWYAVVLNLCQCVMLLPVQGQDVRWIRCLSVMLRYYWLLITTLFVAYGSMLGYFAAVVRTEKARAALATMTVACLFIALECGIAAIFLEPNLRRTRRDLRGTGRGSGSVVRETGRGSMTSSRLSAARERMSRWMRRSSMASVAGQLGEGTWDCCGDWPPKRGGAALRYLWRVKRICIFCCGTSTIILYSIAGWVRAAPQTEPTTRPPSTAVDGSP